MTVPSAVLCDMTAPGREVRSSAVDAPTTGQAGKRSSAFRKVLDSLPWCGPAASRRFAGIEPGTIVRALR